MAQHDEDETRGFVWLTAIKLLLTLGLIVGIIVAFGVTVILPAVFSVIDLGQGLSN